MYLAMQCRAADGLIEPHGGSLKNTMVTDPAEKKKLIAECEGRKIEVSDRNACDIELLAVGGFSPLEGFMNEVLSPCSHTRSPTALLSTTVASQRRSKTTKPRTLFPYARMCLR